MRRIQSRTIPNLWFKVCNLILNEGRDFTVGRGSECTLTKKLSVAIEIVDPEERPLIHDKAPVSNLEKYTLENLYSDDSYGYDYTYGERLRKGYDQVNRAIDRLKEESNDRQITLVTRRKDDLENDNPPCLTVLDLEIIAGKLRTHSYWRSWDAYAGLPANLGGLQLLTEWMAKEIGVSSGKMFAYCKNLHLYERQFNYVKSLRESGDECQFYQGKI